MKQLKFMKHNHLDHIRTLPCLVCRKEAEPHHLKPIGMGRNRKQDLKEHYSAIPLCREHHSEIHTGGQQQFEQKYNINLWKENFRILMRGI